VEKFQLKKDVKVFCLTAKSFPDGVLDAHQKLHSLVSFNQNRKYFGLSRPEKENNGEIVYKAAAEELEKGELQKHRLEEMAIQKGTYIFTIVSDFMKDAPAIFKAFDKLTSHPNIDPDGYCIEWYLSDKEVRCMVRINDKN
jgi:predicted transcriptional regulator YdeE